LSAQRATAVVPIDQQPRTYELLLRAPTSVESTPLTISSPTFRPPADQRWLGIVLTDAHVFFLPGGLPWWWFTGTALLMQVGLIGLLLRRFNLGAVALMIAVAAWLLLQLPWLLAHGYDRRAATIVTRITAGLGGIYLVTRPRSLRQLNQAWNSSRWLRTRVIGTGVEPQIVAWTRVDWATALTISCVAVLIRIWLIPPMTHWLNGDDYLTGVFALNILQGYHSLYYGHHTGTLASYLIAPVLALTGASIPALLVLPIGLTAALVCILYGLGHDLFGRCGGIGAAAWIALPSATALFWTMKPQPGYLEAITFAALALWGTVRLLWGSASRRRQIGLMVGTALSATLALWAGYVVASILLTCAGLAILRWRQLLRLPKLGFALALLIPLLLWLLPLLLYVKQHPNNHPLWYAFNPSRPDPDPARSFQGFLTLLGPLVLGVTRPARPPVPWLIDLALVGITILVLVVVVWTMVKDRSKAAMIPFMVGGLAVCAFVFSSFGTLFNDARYVLPLYIAFPLCVAALVSSMRKLIHGHWLAPSGLGIILLVNCYSSFSHVPWNLAHTPRTEAVLARVMQQHGVKYVHTSYWMSMGIMFESGATIIGSSLVGPNRESYDKRNEERVLAARGKDTAFVFHKQGSADPLWTRFLDENRINCRSTSVSEYVIYDQCRPFPDILKLTALLPEGIGDS
jgi:hypothetical protein